MCTSIRIYDPVTLKGMGFRMFLTFLPLCFGSSWVLLGFVMLHECSGSLQGHSVRSKIILGMLKTNFLEFSNETTAPFLKLSSCILGRSGLFRKGYESVQSILGTFEEILAYLSRMLANHFSIVLAGKPY